MILLISQQVPIFILTLFEFYPSVCGLFNNLPFGVLGNLDSTTILIMTVRCLLNDATLIDSKTGRLCQLIDRAIVYQLIDTKLIDWPN